MEFVLMWESTELEEVGKCVEKKKRLDRCHYEWKSMEEVGKSATNQLNIPSASATRHLCMTISKHQCSKSYLNQGFSNLSWSTPSIAHLVSEIAPIPLNRALIKGTATCSSVWNHSAHYRVHSFNPIMRRNNECTPDVHSTVREYP